MNLELNSKLNMRRLQNRYISYDNGCLYVRALSLEEGREGAGSNNMIDL